MDYENWSIEQKQEWEQSVKMHARTAWVLIILAVSIGTFLIIKQNSHGTA